MKSSSPLDPFENLLRAGKGRIHMMGIGGVGMAGLAYLLRQRGFTVDGCDRMCGPLCDWLTVRGIRVMQEHSETHAEGEYDFVVFTPAVDENDRELAAFRERGVPAARRGEVLPLMLHGVRSVAVAGTHGKTTTATFTAHLLKSCGFATGWCIGGSSVSPGGVSEFPEDCEALVVEADESDGTLRGYTSEFAVITNIEYDHMEHFVSADDFKKCFSTFAANALKHVVYCADDPIAAEVCGKLETASSYGVSKDADLVLSGIQLESDGSRFLVSGLGLKDESISIPAPGMHNVLNASASILVGLQFGADIEAIRAALSCVTLPDRRNQRVLEGEVTVINDYAHHPTAIEVLLKTPRPERKGRLRAVFQPHRYTRTKALMDDFVRGFDGLDELILVPVYAASEQPLSGGSSHDLYARMRNEARVTRLLYSRSLASAWDYFRKTLEPGDELLVIGAGDVEQIGHWLRRDFSEGRREMMRKLFLQLGEECGTDGLSLDFPLGNKTVFGSGGPADAYFEVSSVDLLGRIWAFCGRNGLRIHVMGAGGNVVVSDLGVRGVTVRMRGEGFCGLSCDGDVISAGSAVTTGRLLDFAEENGLSGLEFLEGMPGVVGGIVKMNAGAFGGEVGARLEKIDCLDSEGSLVTLEKDDISYAYRSMTCLQGRVVLGASFKCVNKDRQAVASERSEIREKRAWMKGQRSVGSVFRNPKGDFAGRLIEGSGLKGFKIGGVAVSAEHANVFVNDGSGTSSDMLALIDLTCAEVRLKTGVALEREVVILE